MSSEVGDMFKGDSADMCARKCTLMLMGVRAEDLVCADMGVRTSIKFIHLVTQ
jgi:hypothetical protein